MVGGDESEGTAPGQWGDGQGLASEIWGWGQEFHSKGSSRSGATWCLPSLYHPNSIAEAQGCGVGGQQGADRCRERRENLGRRGRNEWSFVSRPEVDARGTAVVVL